MKKSALPSSNVLKRASSLSRISLFGCRGSHRCNRTVGIIREILILSFLLSVLIIPACLAQEQQNPFMQWRINPGAEIYTGRSYDIAGAIGASDFIAHWADWKVEDTDCAPDTIIPVRYISSNGAIDPKNFYINPMSFPTGNYFTWDGCREWMVLIKNPDGTFTTKNQTGQAPNENRFAFTVKNPIKSSVPVHALLAPAPYTPPSFVIAKPGQPAATPIPITTASQEMSIPWWQQWWWAELIIIGIVAYIVNDELDIL